MARYFFTAFLTIIISSTSLSYPAPVDFDGELLRWQGLSPTNPLTYNVEAEVSSDLSFFLGIVDESAQMWNDVEGSSVDLVPVDQEGDITITLVRSIEGGDFSSGFSVFDAYDESGPSHCTIEVLIDPFFATESIAKTILHELGHCLGLGHSLVPEAIMSYRLGSNSFALDIDDQAAISRLYPASGGNPKLPPGCAVGSFSGINSFFQTLLLLVPFLILIKKKRPAEAGRYE